VERQGDAHELGGGGFALLFDFLISQGMGGGTSRRMGYGLAWISAQKDLSLLRP